MSKSIYEEALDNTQTLLALVNLKELNSKKKLDMLNQIEQALEQAQKQEKLLNKIKEIIDRQDDSYISSMLEESQRYYEIKKLMIKELENEKNT